MDYLCNKIPYQEWSGVLFYRVQGSIKDPENMICTLEDIYPMDKGSQTATNYEFDTSVFKHMEENNLEDCIMGHVHSHNNMATFFSGTDISELEDNVGNHNIYLSFITNNRNEYIAKICFEVSTNQTFNIQYQARDEKGELYNFTNEEKLNTVSKMVIYDCEIIPEVSVIKVTDSFVKRVDEIIQKANKPTYGGYTGYNHYGTGVPVGNATVNTSAASNPSNWSNGNYKKSYNDWSKTYEDEDDVYYSNSKTKLPLKKTNEVKINPNTTRIYPQGRSSIDVIADRIEIFAVDLLTWNDSATDFIDLDDVIKYFNGFEISGIDLANEVLLNFQEVYEKYFPMYDSASEMSFCIESVIEEYEDFMHMTVLPNAKIYLQPVVSGLKNFLNTFENERSTK